MLIISLTQLYLETFPKYRGVFSTYSSPSPYLQFSDFRLPLPKNIQNRNPPDPQHPPRSPHTPRPELRGPPRPAQILMCLPLSTVSERNFEATAPAPEETMAGLARRAAAVAAKKKESAAEEGTRGDSARRGAEAAVYFVVISILCGILCLCATLIFGGCCRCPWNLGKNIYNWGRFLVFFLYCLQKYRCPSRLLYNLVCTPNTEFLHLTCLKLH